MYAEKVILVHFISMQLNFPVLSMFSCVAPQNAGLAIFTFLGNRTFSEKMVPQNIFTAQATLLPHSVYIDKTKGKWIIFACTG